MEPRKPKGGFFIEVTCPGCGGGLNLQENFFSLTCEHCGSVLRIVMPDTPPVFIIKNRKQDHEARFQIDRYLKENGLPLARSGYILHRLYAPYWKIDAIRLKVNRTAPPILDNGASAGGGYDESSLFDPGIASASGYAPSFSDAAQRQVTLSPFMVTQSAGDNVDDLPFSIGLRTEYVAMTPFSSEEIDDGAQFLPATVSWPDVCAGLSRSAAKRALLETGSGGLEKWELFQPVGSLVYFPYLAAVAEIGQDTRHFLLDGLSGRVVHAEGGPGITEWIASSSAPAEGGRLQVVFHRCTDCGVDLPPTRSIVYKCHNCGVVASLETNRAFGGALQKAASAGNPSDRLFPFWMLKTTPETVRRLASLPAGTTVGDRIIIPGFAITNFETMRRLGQRMTAAFPHLTVGALDDDDRRLVPVTTPLSEAVVLAEISLYSMSLSSRPDMNRQSFTVHPEEAGLLYAPFHQENYFMIDSALGAVTFEHSVVDEQALSETA